MADRRLPRFLRRQEGTIAVLWGMSLVAVMGFAAVAFDLGRVADTQAELQSFADGVALAAAGELDGRADSITRATAAAANLVAGKQTFGTGAQALSGSTAYTLSFLSAIRTNDNDLTASDTVTSDPKQARFVKASVAPKTLSMTFLAATRALSGGSTAAINPLIGAEAVAGFTQEACDITPLMFCLPPADEAAGDDEGYYEADNHIGALIQLRTGGNGAAWGPGDFGFLDPTLASSSSVCAGMTGSNRLRCLMAAAGDLTQCYQTRGVDTEPGQKKGITNTAFNIRFDVYEGSMGSETTNPLYPPAPNVIKGRKIGVNGAGKCNKDDPSTTSMALPKDTCQVTGTCGRFGDGVWDRATYLTTNHGDASGSRLYASGITTPAKYDGTRFEVYLREIQVGDAVAAGTGAILTGADEHGRKMCYQGAASTNPWRRVLTVAGIDCTANPINGAETDVPVAEYFEIFLTRPVDVVTAETGTVGEKFDIWGEVIGSLGRSGVGAGGNGGIFRDVVQLYR
jgi:Flp pilus assembly protein TadG